MAIRLLDPAETPLVPPLTGLINEVYAVAEAGLWRDGWTRTADAELTEFVAAREIATATVDGRLAGVIRVHAVSEDTAEFGMLAASHEHRSIGVGRALVQFAERLAHERGHTAMQLELLWPRERRHPSKVFLDDWYRRIGYRVRRARRPEDAYPELVAALATPCDFVRYEKPLAGVAAHGRQSR